jgi:DNA-binding transcriptional regulator YiaG
MRDYISDEAAPQTPEQCRAARGLLILPMEWLSSYAGLSPDVVFNLERGRIPFKSSADKLLTYLEAEGIRLLPRGAQDLRSEERHTRPSQRALK